MCVLNNFHSIPFPFQNYIISGYVTSIRQQENEMMLCCELSTKVLRTDTCLDQFKVALKSNDFKRTITRILLGNIVITRYNNKTYKIDDIDFTDNPSRTFNVSKNYSVNSSLGLLTQKLKVWCENLIIYTLILSAKIFNFFRL